LFATAFRTAPGPNQPPIQWVPEALSLGLKWPGDEANHSPPSKAEVRNEWSYNSTPPYVFMAWCLIKQRIHFHGVAFVKHRENFTFTFIYTPYFIKIPGIFITVHVPNLIVL
jgi:hypothetical protein